MAPKKIAPKSIEKKAASSEKEKPIVLSPWKKVQTAEGWKRGIKKAKMGK